MLRYIFILLLFSTPVFASSQTADFTIQSNGPFCNPATIRFIQNCTGNPIGFIWDFGNNIKGYAGDISTTYTNAGTFTVKLIAVYDQVTVEVSKTVLINPAVTASIGFDRNYICTPGAINFTAISTGNIVNRTWNFGDLSGTVNTATNNITHTYANFGNYPVTLTVTDATGCAGLANTSIQVTKPAIAATASPTSGCITANVNLSATVNTPVNDFVTNYTWNFGDGSPVSTTAANNTNHPYNAVGTYAPILNITTNGGCTNTYNFPAIAYGTPPFNHIAYPLKTVVCGSETPVFVSKATNANAYVWDFGDGVITQISDTVTQHKYATLGFKTVTVTPFFNGCPGTTISFQIEVIGVIASYTYSNTCANRKVYSFINASQGNLSAVLWNFGDTSPTVSNTDAIHNFPVSGQFATSLTVTDAISGCSDNHIETINTAAPVIVNSDSSICKNANTSFSVTNTYTFGSPQYTWNIVGLNIGPTTSPAITVKASNLGNFNNFVSINYGAQSCPDTIQLNHNILVRGPDLSFNIPSAICLNEIFSATNTSKPFIARDSVIRWYWNFGNTITNDTIYQPPTFFYKSPGSYNVKLTGIDINGCKDSLVKIITVNSIPFLKLIPNIDTICVGQSVPLKAFSSNTFLWSPPANFSCPSCDSVIVNPTVTTKYYVTATTPLNCSVQDSVIVNVYNPFTAIARTNIIYLCLNDQVQLDIEPKMNRITWSPATDLSNPNIYNPLASPLQNTTYTATLTDSAGCFNSSASISIIVKSLPAVNAGPDQIVPYNTTFTITPVYSNNISEYAWTPSTLLSCNDCAIPTGISLNSETYAIKVTSDSACVATDTVSIFIECKYANILMPTAFTPNSDNLNDFYYPLTRGIKSIIKFAIYNRLGQLMFEVKNSPPNNKSFAWNGLFKGQYQPAAAYVYILEALCELDEKITKTGSFLLLR
ncbi:MAG: PKD domain-containing protein [Ferruginibacter sp.]|nr:PKD domain-containing protein [Ferruginibacter sp.]